MRRVMCVALLCAVFALRPTFAAVPAFVDITWMSISNMYYEIGPPKAFLPVHWDGLWGAFEAGVPKPYGDAGVEAILKASGVNVVKPAQYMDKWRLDRSGVRPVANTEVKKALGFN